MKELDEAQDEYERGEHDDAFLMGVEREAQRLFSGAFLAREGLEVVV